MKNYRRCINIGKKKIQTEVLERFVIRVKIDRYIVLTSLHNQKYIRTFMYYIYYSYRI